MTILVAPDSFKDALPSPEVCKAIGRGLQKARPEATIHLFPMADGGEGTADVLTWHLKGEQVHLMVSDPLHRPVEAHYFLSANGEVAFIEMAQASGLQLLRPEERNPLKTSTFGTGELILDALCKGVKKIFLAIGGSATNDAGMGMAAALGWQFLTENGSALAPIGENLHKVGKILPPTTTLPHSGPSITVLCDVNNPLYGLKGAAFVYARQKGANDAAIARLDAGLQYFSNILMQYFGKDFSQAPGSGAAGGMGAGALAFLDAKLQPGIEAIMELTGFETMLKTADLVITGEGKLDGQTMHGKLIHGICKKARHYGVPVIALCGSLDATPDETKAIGLRAAFSLLRKPQSLAEAIASTQEGLEYLSYHVLSIVGFERRLV
jgi:glycerate kinase